MPCQQDSLRICPWSSSHTPCCAISSEPTLTPRAQQPPPHYTESFRSRSFSACCGSFFSTNSPSQPRQVAWGRKKQAPCCVCNSRDREGAGRTQCKEMFSKVPCGSRLKQASAGSSVTGSGRPTRCWPLPFRLKLQDPWCCHQVPWSGWGWCCKWSLTH